MDEECRCLGTRKGMCKNEPKARETSSRAVSYWKEMNKDTKRTYRHQERQKMLLLELMLRYVVAIIPLRYHPQSRLLELKHARHREMNYEPEEGKKEEITENKRRKERPKAENEEERKK